LSLHSRERLPQDLIIFNIPPRPYFDGVDIFIVLIFEEKALLAKQLFRHFFLVFETDETVQEIAAHALAERKRLFQSCLWLLQLLFVQELLLSASVLVHDQVTYRAFVAVVEGQVVGSQLSAFDDRQVDAPQLEQELKHLIAMVDNADHQGSEPLCGLDIDGLHVLICPFLIYLFEEGPGTPYSVELGTEMDGIPVGGLDSNFPLPRYYFFIEQSQQLFGAIFGDEIDYFIFEVLGETLAA
jgi:hypothetical protein